MILSFHTFATKKRFEMNTEDYSCTKTSESKLKAIRCVSSLRATSSQGWSEHKLRRCLGQRTQTLNSIHFALLFRITPSHHPSSLNCEALGVVESHAYQAGPDFWLSKLSKPNRDREFQVRSGLFVIHLVHLFNVVFFLVAPSIM